MCLGEMRIGMEQQQSLFQKISHTILKHIKSQALEIVLFMVAKN